MRSCSVLILILLWVPAAVAAQDALADARRLYNISQYDEAIVAARTALKQPATANAAHVVFGRIQLERYRRSAVPSDLQEARAALRDADPRTLDARERIELMIGFAEVLFLDDRFAAAAEVFEPVLESSSSLGAVAHERVLDWWASAIDRHAQGRPVGERPAIYARITRRMNDELARDPGAGAASYWVVAATRSSGDLESAWTAAMAAWVRAAMTPDRGAALRADLDRLMTQAIIPERASRISPKEPSSTIAGLTGEWEAFKSEWAK